jgi:hypothetical protein
VRPEGLSKFHLIGSRTRDLPNYIYENNSITTCIFILLIRNCFLENRPLCNKDDSYANIFSFPLILKDISPVTYKNVPTSLRTKSSSDGAFTWAYKLVYTVELCPTECGEPCKRYSRQNWEEVFMTFDVAFLNFG